MLLPKGRGYVLQQQMAALEEGILSPVYALQEIYDGVLANHGNKDGDLAMMDDLKEKVEECLETAAENGENAFHHQYLLHRVLSSFCFASLLPF